MYYLYTKKSNTNDYQYELVKPISLFGCNNGFIPWLLAFNIPKGQDEPYTWHVNIVESLINRNYDNHSLVIDLKPNDKKGLSLYEIIDVWGYSYFGWTPIMMHLRGILDNNANKDKKMFSISISELDEPIFTMLYLNGTVKAGEIHGQWTLPNASPANSVLLWPETFEYFSEKALNIINKIKRT